MQESTEGFQRAIGKPFGRLCRGDSHCNAYSIRKSKNRTKNHRPVHTVLVGDFVFLGAMMLALGGFLRQQSQQMLLFAFGQLAREYRNQGVRAGQQRH